MTQINNSPNKQVAVDTEACITKILKDIEAGESPRNAITIACNYYNRIPSHIMTIMEIKERNLES